jgi:hypothetical protein
MAKRISDVARLGQFLAHFDRPDSAVSVTTIRVLLAVARGADSAASITMLLADDGAPVARRTVHSQLNALMGRDRTTTGTPGESAWQLLQARPHPHHKQAQQISLSPNGAALLQTFYPGSVPLSA